MIAIYQEMDKKTFTKLMTAEDKMLGAHQLKEREGIDKYEMGEMWDVLHFLLTGVSAEEPVEEDELSEAIVGEMLLLEGDFFGMHDGGSCTRDRSKTSRDRPKGASSDVQQGRMCSQ